MTQPVDIAVVGAVDPAADAFLDLLSEHRFPVGRVFALGAGDAIGDDVNFGNKLLDVGDVARFDFARVGIAVFFGDAEVVREYFPRARLANCLALDGSGAFAGSVDVSLVIPEVNPARLHAARQQGVVASPGHAAVALASVLAPINEAAGIERIEVVCLEPVSLHGKAAVDELGQQTADLLSFRDIRTDVFRQQIAFNLLPQIGGTDEAGNGEGERDLTTQMQRLFGDPGLPVNVTALQVPVFYGQAMVVHLQTTRALSVADAAALIGGARDVTVVADRDAGPTPVTDATGSEQVLVGRLRAAAGEQNGLNLWIASDNIRRGPAFNCLRLLQALSADGPR